MTAPQVEPWQRGPVPGIPPLLQPAAHAFIMAVEDTAAAVAGLSPEQLWMQPGGAASVGFHLMHLAGATDRLLTYARGERLTDAQRTAANAERLLAEPRPTLDELLAGWRTAVDNAFAQLAATPESTLGDARAIGRAQLPTTVLGLIFHAAEHASRHTGQVVTTARVVRAG